MCIDNYDRQGVASRAIAEAKARQAARAQAARAQAATALAVSNVYPTPSTEGNTSDQAEADQDGGL